MARPSLVAHHASVTVCTIYGAVVLKAGAAAVRALPASIASVAVHHAAPANLTTYGSWSRLARIFCFALSMSGLKLTESFLGRVVEAWCGLPLRRASMS